MFRRYIFLFAILSLYITTVAQNRNNAADGFRAAVVKVNITPETPQWLRGYNPRQSTAVLDSLYHRIVILDDSKTQFYLISSEVVGIPVPEYDRITEILQTPGASPLMTVLSPPRTVPWIA